MAGKGTEIEPSEGGEDVVPIDDGNGGGKKKLLIIVVPLILLLGGGAAAYFTGMLDTVLGKKEVAKTAGEHGEAPVEGEEAAAGGEHGEGAAGPAFLKIPDLIVNLNSDNNEQRYLRLSVQLELKNAADQAAVEKVLPRVVDQFQTYLRELRMSDLRGSKGIYRLQMELLSRVNQAAAPVQVKDVLFQEILIQ